MAGLAIRRSPQKVRVSLRASNTASIPSRRATSCRRSKPARICGVMLSNRPAPSGVASRSQLTAVRLCTRSGCFAMKVLAVLTPQYAWPSTWQRSTPR